MLIISGCLGKEGLIKLFLLGFSQLSKKIAVNNKLAFVNQSLRHYSACVIQK